MHCRIASVCVLPGVLKAQSAATMAGMKNLNLALLVSEDMAGVIYRISYAQ
jgi:hypothetical protein